MIKMVAIQIAVHDKNPLCCHNECPYLCVVRSPEKLRGTGRCCMGLGQPDTLEKKSRQYVRSGRCILAERRMNLKEET
jgi:hypothetical protein